MSIRKVSNLDSYLSSFGTEPQAFDSNVMDNFRNSLFEISKTEDGISPEAAYSSKNINGNDMISAMYYGLSSKFANISALGVFSKKLQLVLDLFDTDPDVEHITKINFGDTNIQEFTVYPIIDGTVKRALWN